MTTICFAEKLLVTLSVNYQEEQYSLIINTPDGDLLIPIDDLKIFKIKPDYLIKAQQTIEDSLYVSLKALENISYSLDSNNLNLKIIFPLNAIEKQVLNFDNNDYTSNTSSNLIGFFLNYDITYNSNRKYSYISGVQELIYFIPIGNLTNTAFINLDLNEKFNFFKKKKSSFFRYKSKIYN